MITLMVQLLHSPQLTEHGNSKRDTYDVFDIKSRTEMLTAPSESPTLTSSEGRWGTSHLLQLKNHLGMISTCKQVQPITHYFLLYFWCPSQIPVVLSPNAK